MDATIADQVKARLEFLGYEITKAEEAFIAKHPKWPNISFHEHRAGFLFSTAYTIKETAKTRRADFLEYINDLNKHASLARFHTGTDSSLVAKCWMPGCYDATVFDSFIELMNNDITALIFKHKKTNVFF
jgi:hypothetical protein